MQHNIRYETPELARYFTEHRVEWAQFYPSERAILERLNLGPGQSVLDIGCGCGGLGLALRERFDVESYIGVEINAPAADAGRQMNSAAVIMCGDILDISVGELSGRQFDLVVSLSCVDWNVQFTEMLTVAWSHVRPGGHLISTFRLTNQTGCNDITQSYQFITADGTRQGEHAAYVVLNAADLMVQLLAFRPAEIIASGYWGAPSATAVTPYTRLCFAAFGIQKRSDGNGPTKFKLHLPDEIAESMTITGSDCAST